jgi:signal transduction histidine kinase
LGSFGIMHGFYEWGEVFIPLQTKISGEQYTTIFTILQMLFLTISFSFLFQFGIELLRPFSTRLRWIRLVPLFVFLVWLIGPFIIGFSLIPDLTEWTSLANACSRYMLCLPGSVISAIGLIRQQRRQIKPMRIPHIDKWMRVAAGAFAAYSVFSGMIVPKTSFFPATIINADSFIHVMILPAYVFRSIIGITLLIAITRSLEIFNIETDVMIRNMEEAQVVANEHEHIARDLHDGALQQVYASGLLAKSLLKHVASDQQAEVKRLIDTINQAISQLREFLPQHRSELSSVDLIGAISPKIEEARRYIRIDTHWEGDPIPPLSIDQTRHFSAFLGEALSNAIRHAKSEKIEISINYQNNMLILEIRDFGQGISLSAEQGFGLKNMGERAKLLSGELTLSSEDQKGTTVLLKMPLKEAANEH